MLWKPTFSVVREWRGSTEVLNVALHSLFYVLWLSNAHLVLVHQVDKFVRSRDLFGMRVCHEYGRLWASLQSTNSLPMIKYKVIERKQLTTCWSCPCSHRQSKGSCQNSYFAFTSQQRACHAISHSQQVVLSLQGLWSEGTSDLLWAWTDRQACEEAAFQAGVKTLQDMD